MASVEWKHWLGRDKSCIVNKKRAIPHGAIILYIYLSSVFPLSVLGDHGKIFFPVVEQGIYLLGVPVGFPITPLVPLLLHSG